MKAQPTPAPPLRFGNEWITYGQPYYKLSVLRPGIYRVTQAYLQSKGISVQNAEDLKLYRRGREVPLYTTASTGGFGPTDYFEFYGEMNDGKLDSALYLDPALQVNSYFSVYTDTSAYFLTQAPGFSKRIQTASSTPQAGQSTLSYHVQQRVWYNTGFGYINNIDTSYKFQQPFQYSIGRSYSGGSDAKLPWSDASEGYTSRILEGAVQNSVTGVYDSVAILARATFIVDTLRNVLQGADTLNAPKPRIRYRIHGNLSPGLIGNEHVVQIWVGRASTALHPVDTVRFQQWHTYEAEIPVNFKDIDPVTGKIFVRFRTRGHAPTQPAGYGDKITLSYIVVKYPQYFDLGGKSRHIYPATGTGPFVINATNAPADAVLFDFTDPDNVKRINPVTPGTASPQFIVPASSTGFAQPHYFITGSSAFYEPVNYKAVTFQQPNTSADYLIVTHEKLTRPTVSWPTQVSNPVQEYASFRSQSGGFTPSVVLVDDLYDQFHYGERSAMAIRHYFDFMRAASPVDDPKFALMIGKGITVGGGAYCSKIRYYKPCQQEDLVPPFGNPGSDLPYVIDWKQGNYVPAIPIGRIAAANSDQVMAYLDKVQTHESLPDSAVWRKNILHLAGGKFESEKAQYLGYLNRYKAIAEGACFGGRVTTKQRVNLNLPTETIDVTTEVNRGVSLITFFGHSSPSISDVEIGFVSDPINNYHNEGKYPLILMNGCASGDVFAASNDPGPASFGEDWILTKKKGAIGFLGHTGVGYAVLINDYSETFYKRAFQNPATYGKPLGEIQKSIIQDLQTEAGASLATDGKYRAMLTEIVLQGDPYVKLFSPAKPDLTFNATTPLRLEASGPAGVTATAPSFNLVIDVRNLGSSCAESDTMTIRIKRSFGGGAPVVIDISRQLIRYRESITVEIPRQFGSEGINLFEVTLDVSDSLDEFNELNNVATLSYYLPISGITTLMPSKYSIVSDPTVTFVGQATDILASGKTYYIEVDTSYLFTSPILSSPLLTGQQATVSWTATIPANFITDTTAFFWRIRFSDTVAWVNSSFTLIPNSPPGWAQVSFGQLLDTRKEGILLTEPSRKWKFEPRSLPIEIRTIGNGIWYAHPPMGLYLAGAHPFQGNASGCGFGTGPGSLIGFNVVVLDQYSLEDVQPDDSLSNLNLCDPQEKFYRFTFKGTYTGTPTQIANARRLDSLQMVAFENLIRKTKDGDYIALTTANDVRFDLIRTRFPSLTDAFQNQLGSNLITTLNDGSPWALVAQKSTSGTPLFPLNELTAPASAPQDTVILHDTLYSNIRSASITSPMIGPATSWSNLIHAVEELSGPADDYKLEVFGFDLNGNTQQLVSSVPQVNTPYDLSQINAATWPMLQLKMTVSDTIDRSAPQLTKWLVTHADVPEGIVRAVDSSIPNKSQGEIFPVTFSFKNISNQAFADSIQVEITITDGTTTTVTTDYLQALSPGDSATLTIQVNTADLRGPSFVRVYVNPKIQVEKYYFNNILELPFNVIFDNQHPLLDVAFDGVHIMDGDIVSPSPEIVIALKDENQTRFKQDTVGMMVQLTSPNGTTENIYLTNPNSTTPNNQLKYGITWTPAGPGQNFTVRFKPEGLPDGIYTLTVQGADASGNKAGMNPYKITFEVINESTISNFYPYPNPFSTSCSFVFTLTGSRIPEQMKIQVLTMTGKVVKEISREELGRLRIGVNGNRATDYHWDGKDEYGDQLANGVYLYRVVIGNKGSDFEARRNKGDQSFKKEYGKLYILR